MGFADAFSRAVHRADGRPLEGRILFWLSRRRAWERGRVLLPRAQQRNHVHVLRERLEGGARAIPPCLGNPSRARAVGRFDPRIRRVMKSGAFGTGSWTDTSPVTGDVWQRWSRYGNPLILLGVTPRPLPCHRVKLGNVLDPTPSTKSISTKVTDESTLMQTDIVRELFHRKPSHSVVYNAQTLLPFGNKASPPVGLIAGN
jgi:hypothetical protein